MKSATFAALLATATLMGGTMLGTGMDAFAQTVAAPTVTTPSAPSVTAPSVPRPSVTAPSLTRPGASAPAATHATPAPGAPPVAAGGDHSHEVWVNTSSKAYHCPGDKYFGKTRHGMYMAEPAAKAKGYKAPHGKACFS